jgi:non-reducing end alpha-L-arabinofuranosidase
MRNGFVGFIGATVFVWTLATAGCSKTSGAETVAAGGSVEHGGSIGTGGSPGSGGTVGSGGSSSKGGSMGTGGKANGGATGAGGAGGGSSITTLAGNKPLGGLTPAEASQLCKDTYAYFGQAITQEALCKWAGLSYGVSSSASTDAKLQENCARQQSACLQSGGMSASCGDIPSNCAATVAQYSTCIADRSAAFNKAVTELAGCATVKTSDLAAIWDYATSDPPASCMSVNSKCPTMDIPTPHADTSGAGGATGGSGGSSQTGGASGSAGAGGVGQTGGVGGATGGGAGAARTGGATGRGGTAQTGGGAGTARTGGVGGSTDAGGTTGTGGGGGSTSVGTLPGDVAKAAGTPFAAAHAMTRALFASYAGPLFKALRDSDKQEKDIGIVATTGLVDLSSLSTFCSGTTCRVTTLYDQSGNGNDMWRADDSSKNQPGTPTICDLMAIEYWQMSDGTKVPIAVSTGALWRDRASCLRNRDKTKAMPTGAKPQTTYTIFHGKYVNGNCCFNYGNTGNAVHYTGPGTLTALNFSTMTFWSKGTGNGPWVMVDFESGVYTGNTGKCGSGIPSGVTCTSTGENPNPSVTYDIVTALFKHNGVDHWALKSGNAKTGSLAVNIDLSSLPKGYSPLKQEGGIGLGEGGAGDHNGNGGFSEGAVIAGETSDATDDAIQKSIVSVYGK